MRHEALILAVELCKYGASMNDEAVIRRAEAFSDFIDREASSTEDFSPGTLGYHEALHMTSFFSDAIDKEILNHPAIEANPALKILAQLSFNAMAELYQKIGEKS